MNAAPEWLKIVQGTSPLIVSIPHAGIEILEDCWDHLGDPGAVRADTDWWLDKLYDFAGALDATIVWTRLSRTVIDVNRDPSGQSLYPGQATTELCPTTDFDGNPLYADGYVPDSAEIARRLDTYHRPYHDALAAEIARLKEAHGIVVLWDAHSIRSQVPRLFAGELPNLNFGANDGASCAPELIARLEAIAGETSFSRITNGRFKGGYITRHYGRPEEGVHAVQLEMAIRTYIDEGEFGNFREGPPLYFNNPTAPANILLKRLLEACIAFAQQGSSHA